MSASKLNHRVIFMCSWNSVYLLLLSIKVVLDLKNYLEFQFTQTMRRSPNKEGSLSETRQVTQPTQATKSQPKQTTQSLNDSNSQVHDFFLHLKWPMINKIVSRMFSMEPMSLFFCHLNVHQSMMKTTEHQPQPSTTKEHM